MCSSSALPTALGLWIGRLNANNVVCTRVCGVLMSDEVLGVGSVGSGGSGSISLMADLTSRATRSI